jgi:hypothetical protein
MGTRPNGSPKYAIEPRVMYEGEEVAQIALDFDKSNEEYGWAYQVVFLKPNGRMDWSRGIHIVYEDSLSFVGEK